MPDEFLGYELVITVAGSNHRDEIVLQSLDLLELKPEFHDVGGVIFERYAGDDEHEYTEIRADHVVARSIKLIPPPPEPAPIGGFTGDPFAFQHEET